MTNSVESGSKLSTQCETIDQIITRLSQTDYFMGKDELIEEIINIKRELIDAQRIKKLNKEMVL